MVQSKPNLIPGGPLPANQEAPLQSPNSYTNTVKTTVKSRRLISALSGGRGTQKHIDPALKHPTYIVNQHPQSRPEPPQLEPMHLDPSMKIIEQKEYLPLPHGGYPHIAASFNLHLDKPVAIIGARLADFAENNAHQRMEQARDLAKFTNLYRHDYHIIVVGDFNC